MVKNEYILIASDTSISLTKIIKSLSGLTDHICVTATRISDCINITKSLHPTLIILNFKDNHNVINSIMSFNKKRLSPIISLSQKFDSSALQTVDNAIVFALSYEHAIQGLNLSYNVETILKLIYSQRNGLHQKTSFHNIEEQSKNLTRYTLELDQKNTMLKNIKERITQLCPNVDMTTRAKLISLVNTIKVSNGNKKNWEDFKMYFENVNPKFVTDLTNKYPTLTAKDLKYCCYLKMNMSNEDIRNILGINQESVRTHKYRLKKKMTLPKHQKLRHYLQSFAN